MLCLLDIFFTLAPGIDVTEATVPKGSAQVKKTRGTSDQGLGHDSRREYMDIILLPAVRRHVI